MPNDALRLQFDGVLVPGPKIDETKTAPAHVKRFQKVRNGMLQPGRSRPTMEAYLIAFDKFAQGEINRHAAGKDIRVEQVSASLNHTKKWFDPSYSGIYVQVSQVIPAADQAKFYRHLAERLEILKKNGIEIVHEG